MCRMRFVIVICLFASLGTSVSEGADTIFGAILDFFDVEVEEAPAAMEAVEVVDAWGNGDNQYTSALKKVLGSEIHYIHKVCRPSDEQMADFMELGLAEVERVSKLYQQQNNRGTSSMPDAHEEFTNAFIKKAKEILKPETAKLYEQEVVARLDAKKEAAMSMMVTIVDRRLILSEEQVEEISEQSNKSWEDDWDRNMMVFMYDEYAPQPPAKVLDDVLNPKQKTVNDNRQNYGRISFGWEQDLGFQPFWGDDGTVLWEVK